MTTGKYCDKLIRPSWIAAETPATDLELDPLGSYIDPNSTNTIADELQSIIDSTTDLNTDNTTILDPEDHKNRNAERILVKRQELRRIAYVDQLIKDAKKAIHNISNMRINLDEYTAENAQEAIQILQGTERDVIDKLRNTLSEQLTSETEINQFLKYVKNLL